jgi:hypothetical protein
MNRPKFSGFKIIANSNKLAAAPLCFCAFLCAGCFGAKRPAFHYPPAAMSRPILPAANPAAGYEEVPNISLETAVLPPRFVGIRGPARPRSAAPAVTATAPETPAEPTLVPELSAGELSSAKTDTQHSLDIAEQNLTFVQGKQLTAAQRDVISKIHVFIDGTHDAMRIQDWQRAKNFAKKAEVLSQELTNHP